MPLSSVSAPNLRLETAATPMGWTFAVHSDGRRVTKDQVSFDLNRADVAVNDHGVVLFYDRDVARTLLAMPRD